jgi:leucyl/phenylalanyl-tRNA--protein transferase
MDVVGATRGLTVDDVLAAYPRGLFPMGYPGRRQITWHRPPVRAILSLDALHVSRSLARRLSKQDFRVSFNEAFDAVMRACADRPSTWISEDILRVYGQLHRLGKAHSVEVWMDGELAGGVYGVHLGGAFFAESKFHRVTDMSKVALVHLARRLKERGFALLEVQYLTGHLSQFGVVEVSQAEYAGRLAAALALDCRFP